MRKLVLAVSVLVAGGLIAAGAVAFAHGDNGRGFKASLTGFEETPSESTPGNGSIRLRVMNGNVIHYRLHYEDFEAAEGQTLFAHIHFGQRGVAGGVSAFLCGGGDKPACTPGQGTFEGDIDAQDVIGPAGQGIAAGEIAELIRAMRKGFTYANVHTTLNPAGLVRGQIGKGHRHGQDNGQGSSGRGKGK
ncbi:MAG TPA: CHRD domain-containing protein [Gaiellaceae bacterium]|nr:CHRD domain-containing protein [Gaiellaceae bacterium]